MLSVAECRQILGRNDPSDEQIEKIRDLLYALAKRTVDQELAGSKYEDSKTTKSQSS